MGNHYNNKKVPWKRYDEVIIQPLYWRILEVLEETMADAADEYGCEQIMKASEAFDFSEYQSSWGVERRLLDVLTDMGLDITGDSSEKWQEEYAQATVNGIWNNPESVALLEQDWHFVNSLEELPEKILPSSYDHSAPINYRDPLPSVQFWAGCPFVREENASHGYLWKEAIDNEYDLDLSIDLGMYEVYLSARWGWYDEDERRVTKGGVPVINYALNHVEILEIRYQGDIVETPLDGAVYEREYGEQDNLFLSVKHDLMAFFAACEEAGVSPYYGDVRLYEYGEVFEDTISDVFTFAVSDSYLFSGEDSPTAVYRNAAYAIANQG